MALSPLPFIFVFAATETGILPIWRLLSASVAAAASLGCAFTLIRQPLLGKLLAGVVAVANIAAALPYLAINPFAALLSAVLLIRIAFALVEFNFPSHADIKKDPLKRCFQNAWWAALMVPFIIVLDKMPGISDNPFSVYAVTASSVMAQILFAHWAVQKKSKQHLLLPITGLTFFGLSFFLSLTEYIAGVALLISLLSLIFLTRIRPQLLKQENWWEVLLYHPARILLTTFIGLSVLGTMLLLFPVSSTKGAIDMVDAAFTSVSAVCVTGLIVLDTPGDFTVSGQFFILLLIQLGGLGIMSVTTVALHAMGRRLSLKQERLLISMTDTDHKDLLHSLATILGFTLIVETIGALSLAILFYFTGDLPLQAAWRGLFTAVSAFCNAGFALQSDSLISYRSHPLLLHMVSVLIILGGMAPATSLVIPKWLQRKKIPISARIALITSVVLLFSGTFFILAFEWNGILQELSFTDKIQNAWFQSVTLRTAGFNSIDMVTMASPTFVVMLCFMFIGGSPGGTAGGVKTTAIGILAMTFWSNITNRNDVVTQNKRIPSATIYRAITMVASGMIMWFVIVLMLEVTQQIPARSIIFEATSAIGTVGLSIGATPLLDEIGKIIIIIAMFAGRIGPMTLFMLLSNDHAPSTSRYPDIKISLT